MNIIEIANVKKTYQVSRNISIFSYIFKNNKHKINALEKISFDIKQGESVALIGKNGAGKSTLIKLITGILKASDGKIKVLGNDPLRYRQKNNFYIGAVFGQRCQLRWDISPHESYLLLKHIYRIQDRIFNKNYHYLKEQLEIGSFIFQPVRTLSLGQKMRAELCAAFLHNPKLILLDEPTMGLDIFSKSAILDYLKKIKENRKLTILLTTHNSQDIEALCERSIIIEKGRILYDGSTENIRNSIDKVDIYCENRNIKSLDMLTSFDHESKNNQISLFNISRINLPEVLSIILNSNIVKEIKIGNQNFDSILKKFYEIRSNDNGR